jgi:hypothetical protein
VREILIAIEECRPAARAGDPYAAGVVDMLEWCLGPGFTCPRCGMTSHHPTDIEQAYCGNCHDWTGGRP